VENKLNIEQIFAQSVPFEYQSEKLKNTIKISPDYRDIETFIRHKTHFTFIDNAIKSRILELPEKIISAFHVWKKFQLQRLDYIKNEFPQRYGTKFVTLKALNVFEFIDPQRYHRYHNDLDLLIPKEDIFSIRDALISQDSFIVGNFTFPSYEFHEHDIDLELENSHYELSQMSKLIPAKKILNNADLSLRGLYSNLRMPICVYKDELFFHITLDLHKNISNDFSPDFFWNNFIEKSSLFPCYRMPIEDLIWYSSLKMYYEIHTSKDHSVKDRLKQLIDIYLLLHEHGESINWDYLIQKSQILEMQPALFYTFSFLNQYLDISYLRNALSTLKLGSKARQNRSKDFGPFIEKLFDV
jgi:hypothetical protein